MVVCLRQTGVTVGNRDLRMQRYEKVEKIGEGVWTFHYPQQAQSVVFGY